MPRQTIVSRKTAKTRAMGAVAFLPLALVLEVFGVFAAWNWPRRHRSIWWLVLGVTLALIAISLIVMSAHYLPKQAYAGFLACIYLQRSRGPGGWKASAQLTGKQVKLPLRSLPWLSSRSLIRIMIVAICSYRTSLRLGLRVDNRWDLRSLHQSQGGAHWARHYR